MNLLRLSPGEVFAGTFEVRELLAEGGMGSVYSAIDRTTGAKVALKVLLPELVANERSRRRFAQEAKVGARINSPAIPEIYGAGIDDETGMPYIAMELLDGSDLREHIRKVGPLSVDEARPILTDVCAALATAHAVGLVHRDLKPENVFLQERDGMTHVKLLDFGIVKVLDPHQTSAPGTGAVGSPMWMAPEQTSAGGRIAPATDCWALGLLAFYVLTGKLYWKAAKGDTGVVGLLREMHLDPIELASVRAEELAPGIQLPDGFDAFFARAVARGFEERFRDAEEASPALAAAFAPGPSDRSQIAFAQTLEVPVFSATPPRSKTAPMGSVSLGPSATATLDGPGPPPGPPRPEVHAAPPFREDRSDPLPVAQAWHEAPTPPPQGRSPARRDVMPRGIPVWDPRTETAAQDALAVDSWGPAPPLASETPIPRTDPPPPIEPSAPPRSALLIWVIAASLIGVSVAMLTAVIVWVALTVTEQREIPSPRPVPTLTPVTPHPVDTPPAPE